MQKLVGWENMLLEYTNILRNNNNFYFHTWAVKMKLIEFLGEVRLYLIVTTTGVAGTSEETSSSGSNETNLATRGSVTGYCGGLTNMLMVTTTMGMLYRVHSNTSYLDFWKKIRLALLHSWFLWSNTANIIQNGSV